MIIIEDLETMIKLDYISFWNRKKWRARKLYISMCNINTAIIKIPFYIPNKNVLCPKCGNYMIHRFKSTHLCMNDYCDFMVVEDDR